MNKAKIILSTVGVLILVAGLGIGIFLVKQNQNIAEKAAPATAIYITPATQNKSPGANFSFSTVMDTATNVIMAIDVRITFDPNAIEIVSLEKGAGVSELDQTITNTFDNTAGKITYTIYTSNSASAVSGQGVEVLKVNAKVKPNAAGGNYNLSFGPATEASAKTETQNVIVSKAGGILTVSGGTASASPTATATSTATATVTPTPTSPPVGGGSSTTSPTKTPTPTTPPIPETGTSWPTIMGTGLGILVVIGALLLAI